MRALLAVLAALSGLHGTVSRGPTAPVCRVGVPCSAPAVPGCLFHWVTKTDDGIRVVDVWESREQFERFGEEQIAPYTQEVGFPNPPETTFYEIHNHLTAG